MIAIAHSEPGQCKPAQGIPPNPPREQLPSLLHLACRIVDMDRQRVRRPAILRYHGIACHQRIKVTLLRGVHRGMPVLAMAGGIQRQVVPRE